MARSTKLRRLGSLVVLLGWAGSASSDTVWLRDGTRVEGSVTRLDGSWLTLQAHGGAERRFPRSSLIRIDFDEPQAPTRPRVEIRIVDADDTMEIDLNGVRVAGPADKTDWIPIQDRLSTGNNELTFRVSNARAVWAYNWSVRIAGKATAYRCGEPRRSGAGCRANGRRGTELGTIDGLASVWIHCDDALGACEIEPD